MDHEQLDRIRTAPGFFAALDQSGGSTPKALAHYGVGQDQWSTEEQMFDLVHAMRTRVMSDPAFDGSRVIGAILFEQTMERAVDGTPTAQYLWQRKHVVPFLKVDKGLAAEEHGVQLMKPIDTLDDLLARAREHGVFGTKMRSVINEADAGGIAAIVEQQFEYAARIADAGLVPILEPEVAIGSAQKEQAEAMLADALAAGLADRAGNAPVMFKLTIPTEPGLYRSLAATPDVLRVLALSGGYSRDEACRRLAVDPVMIASFSRALLEGLSAQQSDAEFDEVLDASIEQIYRASTDKTGRPDAS